MAYAPIYKPEQRYSVTAGRITKETHEAFHLAAMRAEANIPDFFTHIVNHLHLIPPCPATPKHKRRKGNTPYALAKEKAEPVSVSAKDFF